jgi:DNA-binding response OmpR family regulator
VIRRALAVSTTPRSLVDDASDGWDAQRQAAAGAYEALVLDDSLSDTDCETLLGRMKAIGMGAPALVLTSAWL